MPVFRQKRDRDALARIRPVGFGIHFDGGFLMMIEIRERCVTFTPPEGAAYLMGDFSDWDEKSLPIREPVTIEFPEGASVEYAFLNATKQPMTDPTNSRRPKNP